MIFPLLSCDHKMKAKDIYLGTLAQYTKVGF